MMEETPLFSVVTPLLNESDNIIPLLKEISDVMSRQAWPYEILLIDDGSTDATPQILKKLIREDPHVRAFIFRVHRGKSAALACGFQNARGSYVVTLDGDLQDSPEEITTLWKVMKEENADLVSGWKKKRNDPWHKIVSSRIFNAFVRGITGLRLHDFNCGLKLYRAVVIRDLPLYGELHRFIPALVSWRGFRVTEAPVIHRPRKFGKSKYGIERMFGMVVDLLTVAFLMRYEGKPSHLFSGFGLVFLAVGVLINAHLLLTKLLGGSIAPHYPYMVLGVTLLLIGLQCVFFGLLAEMVLYFSRDRVSRGFCHSFPPEEPGR